MTPRATYRFQFHRDFPFAAAEALVPYLAGLGICHAYASPITVAVPGSQHGYDVVDPTRINPELGGEEALRSFVAALRRHDMGLIIDIVPNHMGVAGGHNAWWNDVLRHGPASAHATFFDIDWRRPVLLPILGAPLAQVLAAGDIAIDRSGSEPMLVAYGEHRVPIRPEDQGDLPADGDRKALSALLARQHYRLGWWRQANDALNWRRFFTISELAGLRAEDPAVFEATHALYFRLYGEGLIDGLRVDHVDGLADPAGYCRTLRQRMDVIDRPAGVPPGPAYIVVEKILGPGETLPTDWGVDGTSGYDFMEEVSAVLHDPAGAAPLESLWQEFSDRDLPFHAEELQARQDMLAWAFEGQLAACVEAFADLAASAPGTAGLTGGMLRRAVQRMLWVFPVYRTYGTGTDAPAGDAAVRDRVRRDAARFTPPGEAAVVDRVLDWLSGTGPGDPALASVAVRRFQQLSAPIAAKAVEDTAFYRYAALLSRLDVGFDASQLAGSIGDFHAACARRAADFPHAMLATATHDHKRGEDVRARLSVLSAVPGAWREAVARWDALADGADSGVAPADRYALWQMLFGAWPEGLAADDADGLAAYAERLIAWQEKALREAKLRSSWEAPVHDYEAAAAALVRRACDPGATALPGAVADFVAATAGATLAAMLAQAGLHYTVPGMPDCYQGGELPDFSMVDPDNRRPVDYDRRQALATGDTAHHPKFALIFDLLRRRQADPDLFAQGSYAVAQVRGVRADRIVAFVRRHGGRTMHCAIAVRCADALVGSGAPTPPADWWGDTAVVFGGTPVPAATLFAEGPVSVVLSDAA